MSKDKCPYCHQYKDDGYLYEDDISVITKHLYGKAQQVKWTGKDLNNYEVDCDDSVCTTDCYQDCKIVCTNKGKYFLAVDGEWTTYFPINCCPICGRDFSEGKNKPSKDMYKWLSKMNDDIFKTVMDFAKRINNNSYFRVSFEWKAESNDISISIATKQYRSVIDILIKNYNVSSYLHGQGVVSSQQIADLIWLLNEVDNFVEEIEPMLSKENSNE